MIGNSGFKRAAGISVVMAGTLLAGCGKKDVAPASPKVGWVRLGPLVAHHPLMAEVERLRRVEQAFQKQPDVTVPGTVDSEMVLPALPTLGPVRENANVAQRRAAQRRRLQLAAEQGLDNYAEGRELRRQRLYEQRRTELAAAFRARDADTERAARFAVEQEIAAQLSALAKEKLDVEAQLAVLDGQLQQETLTVGPARLEDLEAEIRKLEADPAVEGISPRARLTLRRRRLQVVLDGVLGRIASINQQGNARIAALAANAEEKRNAELDAALSKLQQADVLAAIGPEQREALRRVLAAEARSASLERQVIQTATRGGRSGAASFAVDRVVNGNGTVPSLQEATARIRRQRQNLQRFIVESVAEAVRDAAHQQNIVVTLVPNQATERGSGAKGTAGRPGIDMTQDFLRWVQWGEPLPRSGKTSSNGTVPQARAEDGGKDMRS